MQKAVVFGLFETGLGVIRSLGQNKISVIGIDFKKDIAWYSKYVDPKICPHPLNEEAEFLNWVDSVFSGDQQKKPVFFTSDDFLMCFSKNRNVLSKYFLFNLPEHSLLQKISDKYEQYCLADKAGIVLPKTLVIKSKEMLTADLSETLSYPIFIKGLEVNSWREKISGTIKGFLVNSKTEFEEKANQILYKNVPIVVQEVITGNDSNHFKYCAYISKDGKTLGEFTLKKIRQNPIHFGVGASVESVIDDELLELGRKLFKNINFTGIGSAEFKRDERDKQLKLIEINPRYWQQNYLSTFCGVNFPYLNYLDVLNEKVTPANNFKSGVKWINRYMDLESYLKYRKEGLTFFEWRRSLRGKKTYSDFTWADPLPAFYEIGFGWKLIKAPWFIIKRIIK
ncbi:MAG: ATP-grasp domain-containing protein [Bacteroidia bacterium]|nr:ATP-grasp domain-containing protein [Bacteroidia bacterium]